MIGNLRHVPPLLFHHRLTEVTYFVTDICNMKCRHCFVHDALNNRRERLSVEEIERMATFIPAMQRVHLGGGEPFTRHDIADLAVTVSNKWRAGVVCIPTNGWFTDRYAPFIRHVGERICGNLRLHFSINSSDPKEMDDFTQLKGSFARWRTSIDQALEMSASYPQITVVALATYNEHNQHRFIDLIDFLHDQVGVEDFSFQLVRTHGGYAPPLDIDGFRAASDYYFRKFDRHNRVLAAFRQATRAANADYFEQPEFQKACTSGKLRVVMSPDGNVYPCEKIGYPNLKDMHRTLMGNIRDFGYDLNALVKSATGRAVHRQICVDKCHCDHNIDQSLRLLSSPNFRNAVLKSAVGMEMRDRERNAQP
ncbi:radical SAM protein [Sphingomonas sp.]|uniref:radical SAM protein n=1 Tax=Sphingomonas sp. TaxID=28214 RepID=UPI001ED6A16B|nr:radical SAM protein [Sphingomonas sp.]MBX3595439.1 radical SAM protein [Sphingomonas sp.]